jgi:hypothetical protein
VVVALEHVGTDDRQVAERPVVLIHVGDLVVRDQRHDVDGVQALHALQPFEAAAVAQVVIRDRHDLGHELAVGETLADALQQLFALSCGRPGAILRRQEGQPHPQRHAQLGNLVLDGRSAAVRIEEFDQAGRIVRLPRLCVTEHHSIQRCASGQHESGDARQRENAAGARDSKLHDDSPFIDVNIGSMRGALSAGVASGATKVAEVARKAPQSSVP